MKTHYNTPLLKILMWIPIVYRIKFILLEYRFHCRVLSQFIPPVTFFGLCIRVL